MIRRLAILALCAFLLPAAGRAAPGAPEVRVSLLDGGRLVSGEHLAGLRIAMPPGWHTYWRHPGEAGIPPSLDWTGSRNLAGAVIDWPRPEIIDTFGAYSFGFEAELVLPIRLTPRDPAAPIEARLDLFFGVCRDICIPEEARTAASFPPAGAAPDRREIEAARASRAIGPGAAGITSVTCTLAPDNDDPSVTAEITFAAPPPGTPHGLIESRDAALRLGLPETRRSGRTVTLTAPLHTRKGQSVVLDRSRLRLTLIEPHRLIDIEGCAP